MSLRFKDRSRESVRDGPVGRVVSRLGKDARLDIYAKLHYIYVNYAKLANALG